jgi:excisionase family DNA binding protein
MEGIMSNLESNPDYVSVETAAESLSVSTKTIRNWIKSGKLPAYETGPKLIRINVLDLRAFCKPARQANWTQIVDERSKLMDAARLRLIELNSKKLVDSIENPLKNTELKRGQNDLG